MIIDGVVADIGEIRQYGVPVWCRGLSAITTKRIGLGGSFCAPVSCGGVAVHPGDVIIADECGVVVMDPADAEAAADRAIAMQDAEVEDARAARRRREAAGHLRRDKVLEEALAKQRRASSSASSEHRARHQLRCRAGSRSSFNW